MAKRTKRTKSAASYGDVVADVAQMFDAMETENQFRKEYPERLLKVMHLALHHNFKMNSFIWFGLDAVMIGVGEDKKQFRFLLNAPEVFTSVDMESIESIDEEISAFYSELARFVEKQKEAERRALVRKNALSKLSSVERKVLGL